ncbi:pyrroloquinoline quinone biosynthesis peptide chaperone PqqD [Thiorhodococcus fuscus]|uniref:PqqA binding protein n=1 Tax=Thiorhodococcus fuscus TaxID=527200 RepID=A0ABW4YEB5_9GAMM
MSTEIEPGRIPRITRQFRLQWEEAQGCHVLLYPEGMVKLNGPAGEILKRCDGERSIDGIVADLETQFAEAPNLRDDVYTFLSTAHDNQWIQFDA